MVLSLCFRRRSLPRPLWRRRQPADPSQSQPAGVLAHPFLAQGAANQIIHAPAMHVSGLPHPHGFPNHEPVRYHRVKAAAVFQYILNGPSETQEDTESSLEVQQPGEIQRRPSWNARTCLNGGGRGDSICNGVASQSYY